MGLYNITHKEELGRRIVYFSAEFGIHECLRIYSGGLGIRALNALGIPPTISHMNEDHAAFPRYHAERGNEMGGRNLQRSNL